MATFADYLDPVAPAKKSSVAQPTKEQMLGRQDLATVIKQFEAMLPDLVPGSASHTRTLENLQMARAELGRSSAAPAAPAAASLSAESQSLLNRNPAPVGAQQAAQPAKTPEVGTMADFLDTPIEAASETAPASKAEPKGLLSVAKGGVKKFLNQSSELGARTLGAIDTAYGALPAVYGAAVQATVRPFTTPQSAEQIGQNSAAAIDKPLGKAFGITGNQAYQKPLGGITEPIAKEVNRMANVLGMTPEQISEKTGIPAQDIRNMVVIGSTAVPQVAKQLAPVAATAAKPFQQMAKELEIQPRSTTPAGGSVGAAAVLDETAVKQALAGATPELQKAIGNIPVNKVNLPTLQKHIEADSLPVPVRLTEGQATGDIVKLSNEQNRRGRDTELAQRFNEQNKQLTDNLSAIRETAAPDVYGTKTIENSQGLIDAYKSLDQAKTADISAAYKALSDANGGQFPVDGVAIARNAERLLSKELKSEFLPASIKAQLERFKAGEPMTFEQFEALRTNLAAEIRKAKRAGDGNAAMASGFVRQALEDLPMTGKVGSDLKPLADTARSLAKQRFDLLKKDPAYKAAVEDTVPADKFIDKFVVNGVNKNINAMVENLGRDSAAHQHMAAGTVNWLKDKAGIVDETGNFSQAGYNKALKKLEDVKNLQEIFNQQSASQLKTLGNVARYTQAQPRGSFVGNSNTFTAALAEKAAALTKTGVEGGLNVVVPGLQLGTSVMEMRARRASQAETRKALETGAGTKQSGKNKINDLSK